MTEPNWMRFLKAKGLWEEFCTFREAEVPERAAAMRESIRRSKQRTREREGPLRQCTAKARSGARCENTYRGPSKTCAPHTPGGLIWPRSAARPSFAP